MYDSDCISRSQAFLFPSNSSSLLTYSLSDITLRLGSLAVVMNMESFIGVPLAKKAHLLTRTLYSSVCNGCRSLSLAPFIEGHIHGLSLQLCSLGTRHPRCFMYRHRNVPPQLNRCCKYTCILLPMRAFLSAAMRRFAASIYPLSCRTS